jgi:hypothetical protein
MKTSSSGLGPGPAACVGPAEAVVEATRLSGTPGSCSFMITTRPCADRGQPAAVAFLADLPGVFEVETHGSGLLLFQLILRG